MTKGGNPSDWYLWMGGPEGPLGPLAAVDVRLRDGQTLRARVCDLDWRRGEDHPGRDIVSYRYADGEPVDVMAGPPKLTGGSSNYYVVEVRKPRALKPYTAECLDLIEALGMSFNEGEAFKAIWRKAAARQGNGKPGEGGSALYNAEKVHFYGGRLVAQAEGEEP